MVASALCLSSSDKWLHNSPAKSVNKYYFSWKWMSFFQVYLKGTCTTPWDAEKMWQNIHEHSSLWHDSRRKEPFLFFNQFCAVAIAFNCFPGNGKGRWWYFEQAKFIECILTATKSVWYLHTKRSKHKLNLFGKLVEYYTLDDGILNRQSSLSVFSRLPKALDICIPKGQNISLTFSGNLLNIIP